MSTRNDVDREYRGNGRRKWEDRPTKGGGAVRHHAAADVYVWWTPVRTHRGGERVGAPPCHAPPGPRILWYSGGGYS